jgi:hypothetical protein
VTDLSQSPDPQSNQQNLSAVSFYPRVSSEVYRYSVYVPLVEGYQGGEASASVRDVADIFEGWMRARGEADRPYFTGFVIGGKDKAGQPTVNALFGWHEQNHSFTTIREENAIIEISSHPELHKGFTAEQFDEMLASLTSALGSAFRQKRIYAMRGHGLLTIFQEEGSRTPTQIDE